MAKKQIKPKSFTDEEGEWKALIGMNIFLFFLQQITGNWLALSAWILEQQFIYITTLSGVSTIVACIFVTAVPVLAV